MRMDPPASYRYRETLPAAMEEIAYRCERVVFRGRSRYQRIDIVDTLAHGRMLFLDGIAQSAESDEFIYHEMLVHPAMFSQSRPRSVLIIGGAEGATLREVLLHPTVERVVMVDIDAELVEVCRAHLASWHRGSFEDPRVELAIDDGRRFLARSHERFDCIILDLSDPEEGSPARLLFTLEFYGLVRDRLSPGGAVAVQGEAIGPADIALHARIKNTLDRVFPRVMACPYTLPSFHRPDAQILATIDPHWSLDALTRRIELSPMELRHLSSSYARGMFLLPAYVARAYLIHNNILTDHDSGAPGHS
ncbi:MAG: fused MFS/spermidine synthase [Syntrophobacteraceae bacterium]|nr:fused MFS/spermidine synthase [Syntrophobacteraceae bacterium]